MTLISPNFSLEEMTVTKSGLSNVPNALQIASMKDLAENILEPLRAALGCPVVINSCFRSPDVNKDAGGASTSQHLKGQAADIHAPGVDNEAIYRYIQTHLPFDQLIAERLKEGDGNAGWIHVSYNYSNNRRESLSGLGNGVYVKGLQYVD